MNVNPKILHVDSSQKVTGEIERKGMDRLKFKILLNPIVITKRLSPVQNEERLLDIP